MILMDEPTRPAIGATQTGGDICSVRRQALSWGLLGTLGVVLPSLWSREAGAEPVLAQAGGRRTSGMTPTDFMAEAERARVLAVEAGDQSYGAIVVKDGRLVGFGPSRVVVNSDPTAHAEIEAIRDAAKRLGRGDLSGAILYSTSRACPMCEAAGFWANLGGMIHGPSLIDAGAPQLRRCA